MKQNRPDPTRLHPSGAQAVPDGDGWTERTRATGRRGNHHVDYDLRATTKAETVARLADFSMTGL